MMEQNTEVKLKQLLKEERIQLWNPPFSESGGESSRPHMQELAERFAPRLCLTVLEVGGALEAVRLQALSRGQEKKSFRERGVATLELLLPRGGRKAKTKSHLETRLDVLVQEVVDRIGDELGLKCIKLILNGRTLSVDQTLDQQGVKNHSKMMVLKISDAEWKLQLSEEEEKKKNQNESLQRTQKGFQILSERDGSEDSSPFLEIADQRGNPLKIPPEEKKALILAMGFHERGRSLMKKKQFDNALCHLLQADQQFSRCGSSLLLQVDNSAVLQLDVVWCYRALEALCCLDDGRSRLQRAELCFLSVYGEQRQRLRLLKGNTGREEVLFLRLHLLQSLLSYIEGNDVQARHQLSKVEALYSRLCPDPLKVAHLLSLGFSEREARLGLRACEGQLEEAVVHIRTQRQEREEVQQRERRRRSRRSEGVSTLTELGFSRRDASRALQHADGDVDRAYQILLDSSGSDQTTGTTEGSLEQLLYLGFQRDVSQAALRLTGGDVQSATQLLLDHQGALPPELLAGAPPPELLAGAPPPEEPSTSSTGSTEDRQLVSELLEDISHEDDYLDLTLEEERDLITSMKTYLSRGDTHTH